MWFHDYGDATSFQVNYLIYGEGLKEPAAGDLHVVVEVVRQDGGNAVGGGRCREGRTGGGAQRKGPGSWPGFRHEVAGGGRLHMGRLTTVNKRG